MSDQQEQKHTPPEEAEDFFDLMGDEGKKFKKEEKKPEQKKPAAAKKPEPKKYPAGVEVHYSGHKKALPHEMTQAEVFEFLEDDFPELSADRAELRHDEEKNRLVPVLKAHKKGGVADQTGKDSSSATPSLKGLAGAGKSIEVLREPPDRGSYPPVFRLLGADGVYEVRKTRLGTFVARMESDRAVSEGFYPLVPKAPVFLLRKTLEIFRRRPDVEVLVNVVYDRRDGSFHLVWVEQQATAGSVEYDPLPETDDLIVYCEIHSHHRMNAFFSATDDAHEKRSGLYGVVGRVDKTRPQAAFRYSCGGIFRPLRAGELFSPSALADKLVEAPS
ncbi:MAG: Mov34/MPN/PAD-1 family protein [Actinomycetota bacterium]